MLKKWICSSLIFGLFLLSACNQDQPQLSLLAPNAIIVAFGDSLTFGYGAPPEASYPSVLEKITGRKVINAGVPREETGEALQRISSVLEQFHPRLVIVCLGGNDFLHRKPVALAKENLAQIIRIIQKSGAQVVLIGVPAVSINLIVPEFYTELGKEFNIPVDTTTIRNLEDKPEDKSDYIHFNSAGYSILAHKIADLLKQLGATT